MLPFIVKDFFESRFVKNINRRPNCVCQRLGKSGLAIKVFFTDGSKQGGPCIVCRKTWPGRIIGNFILCLETVNPFWIAQLLLNAYDIA
jgi:hypothetical protein